MENFVQPEEISFYIESIRPFKIIDVGTPKWLEVHEMIIKLSQQAILEALQHREEEVKEFLVARDKLRVLVHEAYCIFVWKTNVLRHLLDINPNPQASFLIYTVLFHEGAVVSLLDVALFHVSACEALKESALDLIDYCAQGVAQLIGLASMGHHENESERDVDEAVLSELERQKRDIIYKIGMRCISMLSCLAENATSLSLSATRRMVVTHDIPWLMADALHFRPWQRRTKKGLEKFIDDKWTSVQGEAAAKILKVEAQAWFCMRQLLLNDVCMSSYVIYEERRVHLAKTQGLLNETILDQLPPLIELKQYLCQLGATAATSVRNTKKNLLLEEMPEIREKIIQQAERDGGFLAIAQKREDLFLCDDKEKIMDMAKRLSTAYNTDLLAEYEGTNNEMSESAAFASANSESDKKCNKCAGDAKKKCANCKIVFYCCKQCQVDDWPKHKLECLKV